MTTKKDKETELSKEFPPMESEFDIEVEGEITRKRFIGTFTCRILNRKHRALADRHKALLNGSNPDGLRLDTLQAHHRISYLKYAIMDAPKFWVDSDFGYELFDGNVVDVVYEKVLQFEEDFMSKIWGFEAVKKMKRG